MFDENFLISREFRRDLPSLFKFERLNYMTPAAESPASPSLSRRRRNRPKSKQNHLVETLRQKILAGVYPPGSQLPIQTELAKSWEMSGVTVQKAVEILARQGFVEIRRGIGSFIPQLPPHLRNYAVVFSTRFPSHFHEALRDEAKGIQQQSERIFHFFQIESPSHLLPDYVKLEALVRNRQLAGILLVSSSGLLKIPAIQESEIPRVLISQAPDELGTPTVAYDQEGMIEKSLQYFQEIGVRKLAGFFIGNAQPEWIRLMPMMAEMGIFTRSYWGFGVMPDNAMNAAPIARMLMDYPVNERPDGILVADDHLTEAVEAGLLQSRLPEAHNIRIVAQCNFPDHFSHRLPIKRIGYDAGRLLHAGLEKLDQQRQSASFAQVTMISPLFDHELPPDKVNVGAPRLVNQESVKLA